MQPYLNTLATACNESGLSGGSLGVRDKGRGLSVTVSYSSGCWSYSHQAKVCHYVCEETCNFRFVFMLIRYWFHYMRVILITFVFSESQAMCYFVVCTICIDLNLENSILNIHTNTHIHHWRKLHFLVALFPLLNCIHMHTGMSNSTLIGLFFIGSSGISIWIDKYFYFKYYRYWCEEQLLKSIQLWILKLKPDASVCLKDS